MPPKKSPAPPLVNRAPVPAVKPHEQDTPKKHNDGLEKICYGNLDKKKEHKFPEREAGYYHLRTSRNMTTPSNKMMEDPFSILYKKYQITRFKLDSASGVLQLQGLNISIMHDPTLKEGAVYV